MSRSPVLPTVRRLLGHPVILIVVVLLAFVIGLWAGGGDEASTSAPDGGGSVSTSEGGGEDEVPQVYTCSMHPSVRLSDPDAKCPICFMDLIPVEGGRGGPGRENQLSLDENAVARAGIETSAVERFFPEAAVRLYGKVTTDETRVARLTAWFPGRIERLFVNYVGVPIERGEHVAELYSPELLTAVAELREAARSFRDAEDMSPVVRRSSRQVLEAARQRLRLLGVSSEVIAAAEGGDFDEDNFTVTSPISGVVTDLAAREGDYLDTGEPIATVADLGRLWLDLEAYESQLSKLAWGQRVTFTVESHPGEIFEGRIAFIEPLVDERTRTAAVRIAVDNADRHLKPGMFASATVRMRVDEHGAVLGDELAGRWVAPMHPTIVEDGPGTCEICGMDLVPAESLGVVAGAGSEGVASTQPPLVIPRSAVMFTGARSIVYVQVPDAEMPTFEAREVLIGPRAGDFVTVRAGLEVGERVVTQGAFRIDSDMQIAAKPSMMMPSMANAPDEDPEVPADFVASLGGIYTAYLSLQEALADDDVEAARAAGAAVREAVEAARDETLVGAPLADWRRLRPQLDFAPSGGPDDDGAARDGGAADAALAEASIESLREAFEPLSNAILALERRFGHGLDQMLVRAYCPMAFGNAGAEWLQAGSTIDNPYFGSMMLRCGEVREELPPRGAQGEPGVRGELEGPRGSGAAGEHGGHDHE